MYLIGKSRALLWWLDFCAEYLKAYAVLPHKPSRTLRQRPLIRQSPTGGKVERIGPVTLGKPVENVRVAIEEYMQCYMGIWFVNVVIFLTGGRHDRFLCLSNLLAHVSNPPFLLSAFPTTSIA
jgi:hypothetical protein